MDLNQIRSLRLPLIKPTSSQCYKLVILVIYFDQSIMDNVNNQETIDKKMGIELYEDQLARLGWLYNFNHVIISS